MNIYSKWGNDFHPANRLDSLAGAERAASKCAEMKSPPPPPMSLGLVVHPTFFENSAYAFG